MSKATPSQPIHIARNVDELFPPHGILKIWREPQVVHMDGVGPFNAEMFARYANEIDAIYRAAASEGAYVSVVATQASMLSSLDAIAALAHSVAQVHRDGYGSLAVAWAAALDVEGRDIMISRLQRDVYGPCDIPFAAFEAVPDAVAWARAKLPPNDG